MSDLENVRTYTTLWLTWILSPREAALSILNQRNNAHNVYSQLVAIWVSVAAIEVILTFPLGNMFGIPWNNFGYYGSYFLCSIVALAASPMVTHFVLRAFALKSELQDTLTIYTVLIIYNPIIYLFNLPSLYGTYAIVRLIKQESANRELLDAIKSVLEIAKQPKPHDALYVFITLAQHCSMFVFLLALALVAELFIFWYENERFPVYRALVISQIVAVVLFLVLLVPTEMMGFYSYVQ